MDVPSTLALYAHIGVPKILEDAAALLEEHGWIQGAIHHRATKRTDIYGAIAVAAGVRYSALHDQLELIDTVPRTQLPAALGAWETLDAMCDRDPVEWNDAPGRTVEEVVGLLRRAADRLAIAAR